MLNAIEFQGNEGLEDRCQALLINEVDVFDDSCVDNVSTGGNVNCHFENAEKKMAASHIVAYFATNGLNSPKAYPLDPGNVILKVFRLADN